MMSREPQTTDSFSMLTVFIALVEHYGELGKNKALTELF
jgi:hypothetical protein